MIIKTIKLKISIIKELFNIVLNNLFNKKPYFCILIIKSMIFKWSNLKANLLKGVRDKTILELHHCFITF